MRQIRIADASLCGENNNFSFREKTQIARKLEQLNVYAIELPEIKNSKADLLLVRTLSSFVKGSILSVAAGSSEESIKNAIETLSGAEKAKIKIELPVSPVGMEYTCHKKPAKMLEWIKHAVSMAKQAQEDVEFSAIDATRAEKEFLFSAIETAVGAGATSVTICDNAAQMMPDDFADFIKEITQKVSVPVGVSCSNVNGLGVACAILAVKNGASVVKTDVSGNIVPLETFANIIKNSGNTFGISADVQVTQLSRIINQISWIIGSDNKEKGLVSSSNEELSELSLDVSCSRAEVSSAVTSLGYDLSEDDLLKVYDEVIKVAEKKQVGSKDLEAIVASTAHQVPETYKLVNYVVNSGNIISASAQITLMKDDKEIQGVSIGDGPVAAAFKTIGQIIGHHYELDDFQIQSVTEGTEAMGSAIVKLRNDGKLYSGNGISTDIIGASIRAYISAVNKIVYEEE